MLQHHRFKFVCYLHNICRRFCNANPKEFSCTIEYKCTQMAHAMNTRSYIEIICYLFFLMPFRETKSTKEIEYKYCINLREL